MIQSQVLEGVRESPDFVLDSMGPRPYYPITTGFDGVAVPLDLILP